MKNKNVFLILGVTAIVVILIVVKNIFYNPEAKLGAKERKEKEKLTVKVLIAAAQPLSEEIFANGSILPFEEVELKPESPGKITGIYFKEGTAVEKGALLVKINDSELQAQLTKAELKKKIAEDKEYRQRQLLQIKGTTQEQYDNALLELQLADAEIKLIRAQIDKTEIRAPFSGYIGVRNVSEGSMVSSSTIISSLVKLDSLKIDFSLPEKYFALLKKGDPVRFTVTGTDKELTAVIYAIQPKISETSRSLVVRAAAKNYDKSIPAGAYTEVRMKTTDNRSGYLLPAQAVQPDFKGHKVFLYSGGKAVPKQVTVGYRDESYVRVTEGLENGDTVIVSGIISLRPNMPVLIGEFIAGDKK